MIFNKTTKTLKVENKERSPCRHCRNLLDMNETYYFCDQDNLLICHPCRKKPCIEKKSHTDYLILEIKEMESEEK